jgi:lipopolysaccharide export system permease protein
MFLGLARSSELVVTRAAGRSALRALMAPVMVALAIGLVGIAMINPIVAATMKEYEARTAALLQDDRSVLTLSDGGLWLRQGDETGQTVIRAETANLDGTQLSGVTFLTFARDGTPKRRIEARTAVLQGPVWALTDAKSWPLAGVDNPETRATRHPTLDIPSNLTAEQIRNSFGAPASIPIWDLPRFIDRLHEAGFAAKRHEVWLQMELALPGFLVAMVLIGAGFTMRHQRGGRTGVMVLAAILLGFGLYFIRNFAQILGENGQIPVLLAAWAPPLAAIGLSMGLLLHLEDG